MITLEPNDEAGWQVVSRPDNEEARVISTARTRSAAQMAGIGQLQDDMRDLCAIPTNEPRPVEKKPIRLALSCAVMPIGEILISRDEAERITESGQVEYLKFYCETVHGIDRCSIIEADFDALVAARGERKEEDEQVKLAV